MSGQNVRALAEDDVVPASGRASEVTCRKKREKGQKLREPLAKFRGSSCPTAKIELTCHCLEALVALTLTNLVRCHVIPQPGRTKKETGGKSYANSFTKFIAHSQNRTDDLVMT